MKKNTEGLVIVGENLLDPNSRRRAIEEIENMAHLLFDLTLQKDSSTGLSDADIETARKIGKKMRNKTGALEDTRGLYSEQIVTKTKGKNGRVL